MNNLSTPENAIVINYLTTLQQLEMAVPSASNNLDSDSASVWTHNRNEVGDRLQLLDEWRRRLCSFLGVPLGEGLERPGLRWAI